jgi:hypothetical protein
MTPSQRSARARMGAYAQQATHDTHDTTRAAQHASQVKRYEDQVDPDRVLSEEERARRVRAARRAYMIGLALRPRTRRS